MDVSVPDEYLRQIRHQAEKSYPHETCGILVGPQDKREKVTRIYACRNVQDEYHVSDPVNFPRTAETAYFIDPGELFRIQRESRKRGEEIRVIYHSHVNAGAYFSEEDQRIALCEGKPAYPGVTYLVVSVKDGKAGEAGLFSWDEASGTFVKMAAKV